MKREQILFPKHRTVGEAEQYLRQALPDLSRDDLVQLPNALSGFLEEAEIQQIPFSTIADKFSRLVLPVDAGECYDGDAFGGYYAWGFSESMSALVTSSEAIQLRAYAYYLYVIQRSGRYAEDNAAYLLYRLTRYAFSVDKQRANAIAHYLHCLLDLADITPFNPLYSEDIGPALRLAIALIVAKFDLSLWVDAAQIKPCLEVYWPQNDLSHYYWDTSYCHSDSWLELYQLIDGEHGLSEVLEFALYADYGELN